MKLETYKIKKLSRFEKHKEEIVKIEEYIKEMNQALEEIKMIERIKIKTYDFVAVKNMYNITKESIDLLNSEKKRLEKTLKEK